MKNKKKDDLYIIPKSNKRSDDEEQMLLEYSMSIVDSGNGVKLAITNDYEAIKAIDKIDRFVRSTLIDSDGECFSLSTDEKKIVKSLVGEKFHCNINLLISNIEYISFDNKFSPCFALFYENVRKHILEHVPLPYHPLYGTPEYRRILVRQMNYCVEEIRREGRSILFKNLNRNHIRASLENYRGALLLADNLLSKCSKLLVIRIDLAYKEDYKWTGNHGMSVTKDEVYAHRAAFIKYINIEFNEALEGYVWKTEYALEKKFHHHFIIFLNGQMHKKDISIAMDMGEHWNDVITQKKGLYWNVNAKFDYNNPKCGIGMIRHSDVNRIANLKERVIAYLCKIDYLVRYVGGKNRGFGRSSMKAKNEVKLGRPRKSACIDTVEKEEVVV